MTVRTQSVIRIIANRLGVSNAYAEKAIVDVLGENAFDHITFEQYEKMRDMSGTPKK